jgi:DNA-binding transcriptional regulator YhcF (GntR family)
MQIVLNRNSGVPVRDQLVTQLELQILAGVLPPGAKLASTRALARRLSIHYNTVAAAYADMRAAGHIRVRKGAGLFVRPGGPATFQEAEGLDEMVRLVLHTAFRKGYAAPQIRAALDRWLAAAPPDRLVSVDPCIEMAELMGREVALAVGVPTASCTLDDIERDPALVSGAILLALPYHLERLRTLVPGTPVEVVNIEVPKADSGAVESLPQGALVLLMTHAPTIVPFATVIARSLRHEDAHVEVRTLAQARDWRRLVRAADAVFADCVCAPPVRKAGARRVHEYRILSETTLGRVRDALPALGLRDATAPG